MKVANSTTRLLLELLEHNHYIILDVVQSGMIGCSMIKLKVVIWLAVEYEFKLKLLHVPIVYCRFRTGHVDSSHPTHIPLETLL